jgi:hypothetical protein
MRTHDPESDSRRRRVPRGVVLAVAAALLAAMAAGCGGGSASPGVASLATTAPATQPASTDGNSTAGGKTQTFSSCMRSHGVPNFPDANKDGGIAIDASSGLDPSSAKFQAAQSACQKLAPNGGKPPSRAEQAKAQAGALKFSACMRSHGVPNFPDPEFSGGMTRITIGAKNGEMDPQSPVFQAAQKTCQKLMPGGGPKSRAGNGAAGATQSQTRVPGR